MTPRDDRQRALISYEPNPALAWLYHRFFENIEVDESWAAQVREADRRGTVIYVLRNLSFVDFFALDYLTKRLELPQVRFANDLGLWVLEPMGRGWLEALRPRTEEEDAADLRRVIEAGASAALFLKRAPDLFDAHAKKRAEGDAFLRAVLQAQRERETPILLVPQVFVWSKHPDQAKANAVDYLFGPREWPGRVRTVAQFLLNYRHVTLRAGEPIDLKAFLAQEGDANGSVDREVLVRRLTYALLRKLERERHAVVGPTKKPADRLRDEVLRSPKLQKIARDMAGESPDARRALLTKADGWLREMEAALDMNAMGAMDAAFDATVARMYTDFEVDQEGLAKLREVSKDATLVLLPSHKSHVDYIILSRIFYRARIPIPIIAAGDNLSFFPLGTVLRRGGAFFIRRSFAGDRLYAAVVDAYIRRLIKDGFSLEFFLEGGRSRTGKLLPPKLGLLSMVVDAALGAPSRKVYFCPISIGYERVVEEESYVSELTGGEKKKEDIGGLVSALETVAGRYGRLSVQFGEPLTLQGVLREIEPDAEDDAIASLTPAKRRALVTRLAYRAMNEINQVTAVTAGALVATALLTHGRRGITHVELIEECERLVATLRRFGARFSPTLAQPGNSRSLRREAIREACELFIRAGHVRAHLPGAASSKRRAPRVRAGGEAIYVVPDEARLSLDLSKNILVHFFVSRGLVSTCVLAPPGSPWNRDTLGERVLWLSRLFKYEFQFRADAPFDTIFEETLLEMEADGEIMRDASGVSVGPAGEQIVAYARILRNFVEAYRIAARALTTMKKASLLPKDLSKRAIAVGERMFLAGEIERREAVSASLFENAFAAFADQGVLRRDDGKLALAESFTTPETLRIVEERIAEYLRPRR